MTFAIKGRVLPASRRFLPVIWSNSRRLMAKVIICLPFFPKYNADKNKGCTVWYIPDKYAHINILKSPLNGQRLFLHM